MNTFAIYQAIVILVGIGFLLFGFYSYKSGRTYGTTWDEYRGGWIYKAIYPTKYEQFTFFYFLIGVAILVGTAVVLIALN